MGELAGEARKLTGDTGFEDLLPRRRAMGTAVRLGDLIGVSKTLRRRWRGRASRRAPRSSGGVSGRLSGSGGSSSEGEEVGLEGSLGGKGRRSPYWGSMAGLITRGRTSGSTSSKLRAWRSPSPEAERS